MKSAIMSFVVPMLVGAVMCIIETKTNQNYHFYILDLFYNASISLFFYIVIKSLIKAYIRWYIAGIALIFLILGAVVEGARRLEGVHTVLYNIAVPGVCENLEHTLIYIFLSIILSLMHLLKFGYYTRQIKKLI